MLAAVDTASAREDISQMNSVQKLAALLIMLGPDTAAEILKHLDETELEAVSAEMTRLPQIGQELQQQILHEFGEVFGRTANEPQGGLTYTQKVLEKSVGRLRAAGLMKRISTPCAQRTGIAQILHMDSSQLVVLIKREQPQTVAWLLSYLPPEKASKVLVLLPSELQTLVFKRLATLAPTSVEAGQKVVELLHQKVAGVNRSQVNPSDGVQAAADLLNGLDKGVASRLLESLEECNPELAQTIRRKLLIFEELALLERGALHQILRAVDTRDLALALRTASQDLRTAMFACLSKRAVENLNEEISLLGPQKLRDVHAAQNRISETARRLEAEGEIDLRSATSNSLDEVLV